MSIHVLPDDVIAQIAAGEVVERPASVVKELIENALDAGASAVDVMTEKGGRQTIRVADNGTGIKADEAALSITRHATSKLHSIDDLINIQTLGFRGEALSSIAAVSKMSITTRHQDEAAGTFLVLEGSRILKQQAVGAPSGTVVTVEHLFFNTPARLKFLKKETTEKRQISSLVTRYAMAYPRVRFRLEQDGREAFSSIGSGQISDVIMRVLGLDKFRQMIEVSGEDTIRETGQRIGVYGFTSMPDYNRADRSQITLFVNGRWIQDTSLTYAVTQAYHTFLMTGRHPVTILLLDIPPEEVDVNVHPTKAEVRFRDPNIIFAAVQRAVRRAVIEYAETPLLRSSRQPLTTDTFDDHTSRWHSGIDSHNAEQLDIAWELDSPGNYSHQHQTGHDEIYNPGMILDSSNAPLKPRTLPALRVVGQVGAMYIVAEGPVGMYLVDQHAAHERILYEQFMDAQQRKAHITQHTLEVQTIDLSPAEANLIEENLTTLRAVGFEIEPFGVNTFVIRGVPAMLANTDPVEVLEEVLDDLATGQAPGQTSIEERIIIHVCKRAAVKAGQILSLDEMQALMRQLERCESPHTCPHGRPTMLHLSSDHLAREFGRK